MRASGPPKGNALLVRLLPSVEVNRLPGGRQQPRLLQRCRTGTRHGRTTLQHAAPSPVEA
eukprot:15309654-Alexandrium_andersonii.AAC.1